MNLLAFANYVIRLPDWYQKLDYPYCIKLYKQLCMGKFITLCTRCYDMDFVTVRRSTDAMDFYFVSDASRCEWYLDQFRRMRGELEFFCDKRNFWERKLMIENFAANHDEYSGTHKTIRTCVVISNTNVLIAT